MKRITLEKKVYKQKILIMTNTNLQGSRSLFLVQLLKFSSLFSRDISENLRTNGHLQSRQLYPQSNSVPNLNESIFRNILNKTTAHGRHLFTINSATCFSIRREKTYYTCSLLEDQYCQRLKISDITLPSLIKSWGHNKF